MSTTNSDTYLAFVEGSANELIEVTIVEFESQKIKLKLKFKNAKALLDGMKSLFKPKFKAVILDVFLVKAPDFPSNVELCAVIIEKLDELKIAYTFMNREGCILSRLLINGNITAKIDEIIVITWMQNDKLNFFKLKFTVNGYMILDDGILDLNKTSDKQIHNEIYGTSRPQKILFFPTAISVPAILKQTTSIRKIVEPKKLIICKLDESESMEKFVVGTYKWMLDKTFIKFHVLPMCVRRYEIGFKNGGDKNTPMIACNLGTVLPFKKTMEIPASALVFYIAYTESGKTYEIETFQFDVNAHRFDLTLFVDENNILHLRRQPYLWDSISNLPQTLNESNKTKVPVIALFDNSSVICVYKEDSEGYEFLESWNGKFGRELLIAFDKEEMSYCNDAIETYQTKPSFVISELLKIMSMPIEEVLLIKTTTFTVTKDSDNPVLLEFDNFDGKRKAASPALLMALLLKQHLKVIKNELNEKPKELCFCFPLETNKEYRKRMEAQILESCKLLKKSCTFIEI